MPISDKFVRMERVRKFNKCKFGCIFAIIIKSGDIKAQVMNTIIR